MSLVSKVIVDGSECNEVKCGTTNYETIDKSYYQASYKEKDTVDIGGGVTVKAFTVTFKNDTGVKYEYILQQSCNLYYDWKDFSYNFNWKDAKNSILEIPVVDNLSSIFLKIVDDSSFLVFCNVEITFCYNNDEEKTFDVDSNGIHHFNYFPDDEERNYLNSREKEFAKYMKGGIMSPQYTIFCSRQAKVPKHLFKRLTYLTNEDGHSLENAIVDNDIKLKYYFTYKPEDYNGLDSVLISLTKILYNEDSGETAYYGEVTGDSIFRVLGPGGFYYTKRLTNFAISNNNLLDSKHKFFNKVFYYGTTTNNQTGMFYVNKVYAVYDNGSYVGDEWANEEWYPDLEAVDIETDENSSKYSSCKFYQFFHGISTSPAIYRTVSRLYVN